MPTLSSATRFINNRDSVTWVIAESHQSYVKKMQFSTFSWPSNEVATFNI
jgi:hypothetical protein